MTKKSESSLIYLVASTPEPRNPRLVREAAQKLQDCRAMLAEGGQAETVRLLDVVLLQLHLQQQGISADELKAFTEVLTGNADARKEGRRFDADHS